MDDMRSSGADAELAPAFWEGTCVGTPHTCARARPLGRTSALRGGVIRWDEDHDVGRLHPLVRERLGNCCEMSIPSRLGLKDRVADGTYDATARQGAYPPDPTMFVRPGTRSIVEMAICRHFEPIVWATGLGHERSSTV